MQREASPEELAQLQKLAKEGINLTPEMLENLKMEINVNPLINSISDRVFQGLTVILEENDKLFPAIQVSNPNFIDTRMRPWNPDFLEVWEQQHLKLSINQTHGFLSFMTHGLEAQLKHYITQPLRPSDVEDLLCIFLARWLANRDESYLHHSHAKKFKLPMQQKFPKKMRDRIQRYLDKFRIIERERRRRESGGENSGDRQSPVYG